MKRKIELVDKFLRFWYVPLLSTRKYFVCIEFSSLL